MKIASWVCYSNPFRTVVRGSPCERQSQPLTPLGACSGSGSLLSANSVLPYYLHFAGNTTPAQKHHVTCSRSHSSWVAEPGLEPSSVLKATMLKQQQNQLAQRLSPTNLFTAALFLMMKDGNKTSENLGGVKKSM